MKKLEIELYRYDNLVFGRVLCQDGSLRARGEIVEKDDFRIISYSSPDLTVKELYVRGNDKKADNRIFCYQFRNEETAIKTCKKIKDCVDLINSEVKMSSSVERIL